MLVGARAVLGGGRTMTGDLTPAPQMPEDVADRHSDRRRNVIINHTSTDLENIVNGHDPDIHHLGNRVWDRLDKMAVEIEQHAIEAQAAENADLRAKLAGAEAVRDKAIQMINKGGAEMLKHAEQARAAGTFAQGIEAAADIVANRGFQTIAQDIRALTPPVDAHPDDLAVDRFALAMKSKLAKKRAEGRGGWDRKDECSQQYLSILLRGHVCKGDPVDVANLAMMLHQRGEVITPTVDVRETPIRCHQYGLTTVDEQQAPQADPVREADDPLRAALEGAVNWLDATICLIEETDCNPDDEERFDDVLMGANLWLASARRALAGEQP